jgi:hypothetical protein
VSSFQYHNAATHGPSFDGQSAGVFLSCVERPVFSMNSVKVDLLKDCCCAVQDTMTFVTKLKFREHINEKKTKQIALNGFNQTFNH